MPPAIFGELDLAIARERAMSERKLLLVDATAEWCGPCKMMDRTTWIDPSVVAWVQEHALAIQIDVDAQNEVAKGLRIEAMPTIIAFVDGIEFDRVVGAKKPKELLAWLDGVTRGETSLLVQQRTVGSEPANMKARYDLARQLARAGRYDEATVEFVWLWEHMLEHEPAMIGVRMSYLAADLARLVNVHPAARVKITDLRHQAAPSSGPIEARTFRDWKVLNEALGEGDQTLAWYDHLPAGARPDLGPLLEHDIIPLLTDAGRWADAGALYDDPIKMLESDARILNHEHPAELIDYIRDHFRKAAAQLLRALCAANRRADALAVETRALEIDPSDAMSNALKAARNS